MRALWHGLTAVLVATGCGGAAVPTPVDPSTPRDPGAPEARTTAEAQREAPPRPDGDPARGEALFAELGCKGCHGGKGEGGGVGPDLFAKPWSDATRTAARATIRRGFPDRDPPMPAYAGQLDDVQLDNLLAFVAPR